MKALSRRSIPAGLMAAFVAILLAYVLPSSQRNPLWETAAWGLVVLAALAGWGSLVREIVAPRERVDLGLRFVWGASALCAIGGTLMTLALMKRSSAMLLVEIGCVLAFVALYREQGAVFRASGVARRLAMRWPALAIVGAVVAVLLGVHYLGAIADWHVNPYDDEIAYLTFVQRLLDTGTLLEPFSLRRLASLGGQSFFQELVALRAAPSQGMTFDRSLCVVIVVALVIGHRSGGRRIRPLFSLGVVLFFLTLPVIAINTASYYSGVAFFLGLFRTISWLDSSRATRAPWKNALVVALVGAAACTLRQNYIVVPAAMLAFSYVARWLRDRGSFAEPIFALALSVGALVPWFVVSWQSNRTFLYPVMLGTANPALQFQSSMATPWDEARLFVATLIEGLPIRLLVVFVLAAAFHRERGARRPLAAYFVGAAVGLVALVHGTTQGDGDTLARYAFGFACAAALAVCLVAGTVRLRAPFGAAHVFAGLTAFALLATIAESRLRLGPTYARTFGNVSALQRTAPRSLGTRPIEAVLYEVLQSKVPPGAKLAVLVDEPHHLDFGRNPIVNLDMPGYSSPPPGMPYFRGSAAVEDYLRGQGVRFVAFMRPDASRYQYRRTYWTERLTDEQEVWRIHAPYVIDLMDNLAELDLRHKRVFEERGIVVMDLEDRP